MPNSFPAGATVATAVRWPRRYTVIILFALSTVLCYVDRVNISIAIIPLAHAKGYSEAERGLVLSSFFWGYLWLQLPGGLLADRFGGKRVLGAGVALWSIATFLTPPATASFGLLLFMRGALGAGEAVNFPAIHSIAARWTLATERARAISLHLSGTALGTIIALLASPPIIIAFGWEAVFYISGLVGLLWLAMWWWKAADWPENSPGVSAAEMAEIRAGRFEVAAAEAIPWGKICREPAVWAIVTAHLCNNFGFYILLLWLPSYLDHTFHVPLKDLGVMAVVPYVAAFVAGNCSGWLADALQRRGMRMTAVRKTLQTIAFGLGAAAVCAMPFAHSATQAVILATISIGGTAIGMGGWGVNHLDVAPRYAGILMGISNTFATLPGIVGVAATGFIVQATGSYSGAFYLAAAVYLVGLVAFDVWGSGERKL
ncbi:MAG TPA: ACS family MFS transporter [Candidatus Binataceae bacterium]|nr:ACS family MFS transporter [Candidatus Binataceae bacterium]